MEKNLIFGPGEHSFLTRICMASSFGGWGAALLWMIVGNPWVGVFAVAVALGLYLLENGVLQGRLEAARADVVDLEKQVVGLRTTIHRMAQAGPGGQCVDTAVEYKRAAFRLRREGSSGSLKSDTSSQSCRF